MAKQPKKKSKADNEYDDFKSQKSRHSKQGS